MKLTLPVISYKSYKNYNGPKLLLFNFFLFPLKIKIMFALQFIIIMNVLGQIINMQNNTTPIRKSYLVVLPPNSINGQKPNEKTKQFPI